MGNFLNNGPKILKLIVRVLSLSEHVSSPPCFGGIRVARSLVFCVVFVDHCLSFLFWPLYCLSFLDLLLLITPNYPQSFQQNAQKPFVFRSKCI